MNKKFVSFISPIYNVNKYLPDLLESFTLLPKDSYELLLIDDLGDEDPSEVIRKFKGKVNYKLIKNKTNLGLGFARNEGLKFISKRATHFMFIDSDDILNDGAWDQIVDANMDITLSSNFVMFSKKSKKTLKSWSNGYYRGSGVSSAWGHLISVCFKDIEFTSQFFEDQRYMSKLTSDCEVGWFKKPIICYRNRKSSILNADNNSKRKAQHIYQFVEELTKSNDDRLILNIKSFKRALVFAKVEFLYISKKNRIGIKLNSKNYSVSMNILAVFLSFFEKITMFWWFYNKLGKRGFYE